MSPAHRVELVRRLLSQYDGTNATSVLELVAETCDVKLREIVIAKDREISQILGKALGYPWFKDDQKNFPGATEEDGVCVGEHVAETLAMEAANRIQNLA